MNLDSKRHFHFGINAILAPSPVFTPASVLRFQQRLAEPERGLLFDQTARQDDQVTMARVSTPLQVSFGPAGGPQVAQLLITAPNPKRLPDDFISEAQDVVAAFREEWSNPIQVVRRDCTIRYLYAAPGQHAFQFLWERRLHQAAEELSALERPILGGGIRLILPPIADVSAPVIEVKIESLLRDASQLYVDTQFTWQGPMPAGAELDVAEMINAVEEYTNGPVHRFLLLEQQ